jgi:hypothetical protein
MRPTVALCALALSACTSLPERARSPIAGAEPRDDLIEPGETHFNHLWKVTSGGNNAEGYWSCAGDRIVFQRQNEAEGLDCDRIFATRLAGGPFEPISSGVGVTTCAYFLPGDTRVLYASTHAALADCPPSIDPAEYRRAGYFWRVFPEYDLWIADLDTGALERLSDEWGYDAEATVSPLGDRIVFTSSRSGDLELWTCALDGSDLRQVTHSPGYDGGAFFSHDGERLVFRAAAYTLGQEAEEIARDRAMLERWRVYPGKLEITIADADGSNRRSVTQLGGANFAPYFFPGDQRIVFSSNHHDPRTPQREFDLFAIDVDGTNLEQITRYAGFDSFPMFSPDGRCLVFASNRGGAPGETNLYVAEWR